MLARFATFAAVFGSGAAFAEEPYFHESARFAKNLCAAVGLEDASCAAYFMTERAMNTARGGFGGVAFSLVFEGSLAQGGNTGLPPGVELTQTDNRVQLTGALGSFAGANGLFQLTSITGDNNIINNNLTLNVAIVNGTAPDALAAITSAFGN
jgi:hypothetical protein